MGNAFAARGVVLYCAFTAPSGLAQPSPASLDGIWQSSYVDQKGAVRSSGTITLVGGRGQWVDNAPREKRCDAIAGPVTATLLASGKVTITVERSQEQGRCDDRAFVLTRGDDNTLSGSFRDAVFKLTRNSGQSSAAPGDSVAPAAPPLKVQMIYFGGNDCPPCVAWRATELPKLQRTESFRSIEYVYVTKSIMSSVPAAAFLPDSVKPYKHKLDHASAGAPGSAQTAIMVNGEVFDYYWGTRNAEDIAERLSAIQARGTYPYERCVEMARSGTQRGMCAKRISPS